MMRSTLLLLALAACTTQDRIVGSDPTARERVIAVATGGMVAYSYDTSTTVLVPEIGGSALTYEFDGPLAGQTFVADNGSRDNSSIWGEVLVAGLPVGNYVVCEDAPAAGTILVSPGDGCELQEVNFGDTHKVVFTHDFAPGSQFGGIHVELTDPNGEDTGPSAVEVFGPNGYDMVIRDSIVVFPASLAVSRPIGDANPLAGRINVLSLPLGVYTVCDVSPPAGLQVNLTLSNICQVDSLTAGNPVGASVVYRHTAQSGVADTTGAVSVVVEGPQGLAGLSLIEIQGGPNAIDQVITDNGPGDAANQIAGRIVVPDLPLGTYAVCQASPPAGLMQNPSAPACQTVTLTVGDPIGQVVVFNDITASGPPPCIACQVRSLTSSSGTARESRFQGARRPNRS